MTDEQPPQSAVPAYADYRHVLPIQTRWMDNDVYGHVNNVIYYSYFDTVINHYLVTEGHLDIHAGPQLGLCVESSCRYLAPAAYPEALRGALRVDRLGRSSVRYGVGIFRRDSPELVAFGQFVHVFVDRTSRRPSPIDGALRAALVRLVAP